MRPHDPVRIALRPVPGEGELPRTVERQPVAALQLRTRMPVVTSRLQNHTHACRPVRVCERSTSG
jgi:hypothetical protein